MRTIDSDGEIDTEITMILKDADVATHYYALPADYKMVSMGEEIESVQNENSKTDNQRRNMPEMQRMMDDMRRSGRVPPEAMEQMRRYQEMVRQQQR